MQISVEILWTADYIRIFAPQTRVVSPRMKYFACASKLHVIMSKNNQFYSVIRFNQQGGVNEEYNNFAFLHSIAYSQIFGTKQKSLQKSWRGLSGYVKVKNGKHKVYLKYHSWNGVKLSEVQLSYLNYCRLGLDTSKGQTNEVEISKSCWFCYYCNHWDAGIKWPFILAFGSIILSLIGIFVK